MKNLATKCRAQTMSEQSHTQRAGRERGLWSSVGILMGVIGFGHTSASAQCAGDLAVARFGREHERLRPGGAAQR